MTCGFYFITLYGYLKAVLLFDLSLTRYCIYCYLIHFFSLHLQCQALESRHCFFVSLQVLGSVFFSLSKHLIMLTSVLLGNGRQFLNKRRKQNSYTKGGKRTIHACWFDLCLFDGLPSQLSWFTDHRSWLFSSPWLYEWWDCWLVICAWFGPDLPMIDTASGHCLWAPVIPSTMS